MRLLKAGIDTTVIALWLGHEQVETTQVYVHADLAIKEQALARTAGVDAKPGRYRPPAPLLPSCRHSDAMLPTETTPRLE